MKILIGYSFYINAIIGSFGIYTIPNKNFLFKLNKLLAPILKLIIKFVFTKNIKLLDDIKYNGIEKLQSYMFFHHDVYTDIELDNHHVGFESDFDQVWNAPLKTKISFLTKTTLKNNSYYFDYVFLIKVNKNDIAIRWEF